MADGPAQPGAPEGRRTRRFMPWSLSNKLLLLTLVFVMMAEVLIYIPSIANFRNVWLQEKLDAAALVSLAASAAPEAALPADLEERMLRSIGVEAIAVKTQGQRWIIAGGEMPSEPAAEHDLTSLKPFDSVRAAFATLLGTGDRLIMITGKPPPGSERFEVVVRESRLRAAMLV